MIIKYSNHYVSINAYNRPNTINDYIYNITHTINCANTLRLFSSSCVTFRNATRITSSNDYLHSVSNYYAAFLDYVG